MGEHYIGASGNLRSQLNDAIKQDFTQILSSNWEGKAIWEHIRDNTLTAAPCMVGKLYGEVPVKLMIVGRAVNGWEVDFKDRSSLEAMVHSVIHQENRLDDFAKKSTLNEDGSKYHYARSFFLRLMRKMVIEFHGTEENWQQRVIWSNLFKVAPRNGNNPSMLMVREDIPFYRDILAREILMHHPDLVLFATDIGDFNRYNDSKRFESFSSLFSPGDINVSDCKFVQAAGTFVEDPSVKIIICCRPESKVVDDMVKEIREVYSKL